MVFIFLERNKEIFYVTIRIYIKNIYTHSANNWKHKAVPYQAEVKRKNIYNKKNNKQRGHI